MTMNEAMPLAAVDDGYAAIKVAYYGRDGRLHAVCVPARAQRGAVLSGLADQAADVYRTQGVTRTVADRIEAEPTRIESYATSDLNRVLVQHALRTAGFGGESILLGTGLPVSAYYQGSAPDQDLIGRKAQSLATPVDALDGLPMPRITAHRVYPQAVMAYIDHVLDLDGQVVGNRRNDKIGVVDVGGRTTDIAVILPGRDGVPVVDTRRSGSVDLGVLDVIDALRPRILARFDLRSIDDYMLDEAVRHGAIKVFGKMESVTDEISAAAEGIAQRIDAQVQMRIQSASDLDALLYVGGGAAVLGGALARYRQVSVADAPHLANARGMAKYLRYVDPEGRAMAASAVEEAV